MAKSLPSPTARIPKPCSLSAGPQCLASVETFVPGCSYAIRHSAAKGSDNQFSGHFENRLNFTLIQLASKTAKGTRFSTRRPRA
jgi:hypothetical protein